MKLYFILFFLCIRVAALEFTPRGIYSATKEACSKITPADLNNQNADKLRAGYFPSREFNEIHNLIRSESTKAVALEMNVTEQISITRYILSEQEFQRALNECYPNNPDMVKFFRKSILRSDNAGKIAGIGIMLITFKGLGRVSTLIKQWSQASYSILLNGFRGLEALILSSFLTRDSSSEKETIHWKKDSNGPANVSEMMLKMEVSLKRQIENEEAKIANCLNCPENEQVILNIRMLQDILANVQYSRHQQTFSF